MSRTVSLALILGDGIGTEVVAEAMRVLSAVAPRAGLDVVTCWVEPSEPSEHVEQGGAVGAGVPQHPGQDHLAVLIDEVLRVVAGVERPVGGLHEPGVRVGGSATG